MDRSVGLSQLLEEIKMTVYEFAFVVEGFDDEDEELLDQLYDEVELVATTTTLGRTLLTFVVDADSPETALKQTLYALQTTAPGLRVTRLDRDLVNVPEVAARTNLSAEAIRLYVTGQRGTIPFASPVGVLAGGAAVYEWSEIYDWCEIAKITVTTHQPIDYLTATRFDAYLVSNQASFRQGSIDVLSVPAMAIWSSRVVVPVYREQLNESYLLGEGTIPSQRYTLSAR